MVTESVINPSLLAMIGAFICFVTTLTALQIGRLMRPDIWRLQDWTAAAALLAALCIVRGWETLDPPVRLDGPLAAAGDILLFLGAALHLRGLPGLLGAHLPRTAPMPCSLRLHPALLAIAISALLALDLSGQTELGRALVRGSAGLCYAIAAWVGLRFPSPALRMGRFAFPVLFASLALMLLAAALLDLRRTALGLPPSAPWPLFLSMIPASWWSCFCMWLVYHDIHQWQEAGRQRAEILNEQVRTAELKTREFARVLHDSVAGTSSSIQFYLDALPPGEAAPPDTVSGLQRLSGMLTTEVRLMIRSFEEPLGAGDDWLKQCRCYILSLLGNFGLRVTWDDSRLHETADAPLPPDLQWILRELAHNTVRHADATCFDVSLASHGDLLQVEVRDDGQGAPQRALERRRGSGLRSITRRVEALSGTTRIVTGEGLGFAIHLSLPRCPTAGQRPLETRRSDLAAHSNTVG